ncbi:MAG: hypothetical protein ACE5ID_05305 [Acidobacteriota bacterium]
MRGVWLFVLAGVLGLLPGGDPGPRAAETSQAEPSSAGQTGDVDRLRQQVEELTRQVQDLTRQMAELQAKLLKEAQAREVEQLKKEAQALAAAGPGKTGGPEEKIDTTTSYVSGTRMQPQLNPEISVVGDVLALGENRKAERFSNREWEIDFDSYLDPFSRLHLTVSLPEDEAVEIEEGYIDFINLPGGLDLILGKKRQQFGVLNRFHRHALDQVDFPLVLEESFGEDGLEGTGASLTWTIPHPWAQTNELTVEVTNGDNDVAFAGADYQRLTYLARLKNFWDLSPTSYLEVGLDALLGSADPHGKLDHDFYALDAAFNWFPPGRSIYRDLTIRGMLLRSRRELAGGMTRRAYGGYLYGQFKFTQRIIAGLRFDRAEDQDGFDKPTWAYTPYLTFWQSEFVRLRGEFSYKSNDMLGIDRRVALQLTFAAGPHKHEA